MLKNITLILTALLLFASFAAADPLPDLYPVKPPTTSQHIEQIKWAYNQGYVYGILANYGWFKPVNYQKNFVLPVIKTAWEAGYVKGVLEVYEWEKTNSKKSTK